MNRTDSDVVTLDRKLCPALLGDALAAVLKRFTLQPKDKDELHFGICLQFGDPADRYYEILDSFRRNPKDPYQLRLDGFKNSNLNEVGEHFGFVFKELGDWPLARGRLLLAKPGFHMKPHRDEIGGRIHIPIVTDEKCLLFVGDRSYHLPADGSVYWVNTHKPHYVVNESRTDRYHLVFTLDELSYSNLSYEQIERERHKKMEIFLRSLLEDSQWSRK